MVQLGYVKPSEWTSVPHIKANYTAYCVNGWRDIMLHHMSSFQRYIMSNYDADLTIFAYPYSYEINELLEEAGVRARIVKLDRNEFEYPALRDMRDNPGDLNLYFHTKGSSRSYSKPIDYWSRYMTYFNIERCDDCIKHLAEYDCVGVSFRTKPFNHYSGNFWWSTKKHMLALPRDFLYWHTDSRYRAEGYVSMISGLYYSACDTAGVSLYHTAYGPDMWVNAKSRIFKV